MDYNDLELLEKDIYTILENADVPYDTRNKVSPKIREMVNLYIMKINHAKYEREITRLETENEVYKAFLTQNNFKILQENDK